jgi:peptidoglycan/xylan/chitin deacetylase (PgdA/CDA1 family)
MNSIPVLMYHHVNKVGSFINISPEMFDKQMRYLREKGYHTINSKDYLEILNGKKKISKKTVMITFDDGWLDNWVYAYPIIKKYEIKAVLFIITSLISNKNKRLTNENKLDISLPDHKGCIDKIKSGSFSEVMLSWEEIKEMEDSGLIDIQSHSHTHERWDKIFNKSTELEEHLYKDLKLSKDLIEEKLSKNCIALCWPWGIYNENYIKIAKRAGFKLCFTTEKGTNSINSDFYRIKRIVIGNIGTINFMKKLFIYSNESITNFYLRYIGK